MMGHLSTRTATLMHEYVHAPLPVLAVQITDANAVEVAALVNGKLYLPNKLSPSLRLYFHCCSGRASAGWGDWIIRDARGFNTMTDLEFTEQYKEKS